VLTAFQSVFDIHNKRA